MEYREFGKTGWKVSKVGFGAWQAGMREWGNDYSLEDVKSAVSTAIENGVNFFDTAEAYGDGYSEKVLGDSLKGEEVFIATKLAGFNAGNPEKSVEKSVRNLGRNIDLYQIHWVPSYYTNLKKTISALEAMVRKGKISHIGVSNFPRDMLEKAVHMTSREEIVSDQLQYSLADRRVENSIIEFCRENKIEIIAWSPLGRGKLTGKYFDEKMPFTASRTLDIGKKGIVPEELKQALKSMSEQKGVTIPKISLRWLVEKGAYPIPGAKNNKQAESNANIFDFSLSSEDMRKLDTASESFLVGEYTNLMPRIIPNLAMKILIKRFL